jgi:hypothetical protein
LRADALRQRGRNRGKIARLHRHDQNIDPAIRHSPGHARAGDIRHGAFPAGNALPGDQRRAGRIAHHQRHIRTGMSQPGGKRATDGAGSHDGKAHHDRGCFRPPRKRAQEDGRHARHREKAPKTHLKPENNAFDGKMVCKERLSGLLCAKYLHHSFA